ncbi:MAG TPA: VPLPA-CTERM sorting domain-containing protein, partial [Rhodobiaceae bacterium]|nr:VPLPA-CTERM sorting domain-containing protein [Rhodobiaceae bacterium]
DVSKIEIFENGAATGDNDFFSLGLGGTLVVEFDPAFTGPAMVVEITNNGP